jgi:hypothetical protein
MVLRGIYGCKREDVLRGWRKLHVGLNNFELFTKYY